MSDFILDKFTCEFCANAYGVLKINGAVMCKGGCDKYYACWDCHKKQPINKNRKWKHCVDCQKKPTMCNKCNKVVVKFGTCLECFKKEHPLKSGVVLL